MEKGLNPILSHLYMNMMLIKYLHKRDPVAGLIMRKQRSEMMVLEQDRKSAYIDQWEWLQTNNGQKKATLVSLDGI